MRILTTLTLLVVGVIHLIPLSGVLGHEHLARLYGAAPSDPSALILMRHRAVLFGIVGGVCMLAAFKPALQWLALVLGSFSVVSFLWLAWSTGGFNAHLQRVVVADVLALLCLAAGAGALALAERAPGTR
ncbi:phosphopantetheine adenylyltransferase [Acidovorax sp. LjRoot118]|uniref:phosphopantetheine adenylyltransferase n=1 Tax=Acidovorax sp. LjRoot118 TaxID=3342256 RepID=UPI003ED07DF8